ncbi:MAG: response regulator transcription factor [Actinobacteria bacterium]|nr:response regulator transcription factor [Actinomycetota bacterium]MBV8561883.1 response regulator transcription factor [Actinomycetota bacterium]
MATTVVIAEDHPAVLVAVADLLAEHGMEVIGRARDGAEALALIERRLPTIALVDLRMPRLGGIELARKVPGVSPKTAVVFYTGYADGSLLAEALDAGARGFVLKDAPLGDLVRALEKVADGGAYVDPVLGSALVTARLDRGAGLLTEREREVLKLLADGLANDEIGRRLFIAPDTVRTHIRKAMEKLDADTRTQAVAEALRLHLIT